MMNRKGAPVAEPAPPTERDREIIRAVIAHGQMTRAQIQRLHFRAGERQSSVQVACRRLAMLTARGYLARTRLPAAAGSGPYVYQPGKGVAILLNEGEQGRAGSRVPRRRIESAADLAHALELVDFYLALKEALEKRRGEIATWMGEREACYRIPGQRALPLTPDAYCLWALGKEEGSFFLEWDRGTESLSRIADKLERYAIYYELKAYQDHLGEMGLRPRLLIVVLDVRRKSTLLHWLAQALAKGRWISLPTILIGVRDDVYADPLGPIWGRPGCSQPMWLTD